MPYGAGAKRIIKRGLSKTKQLVADTINRAYSNSTTVTNPPKEKKVILDMAERRKQNKYGDLL